MSFTIPMAELVRELQTIQDDAAEWDPDGQIEWDVTVYVLSLESGFEWLPDQKFFFKKSEAIEVRDYVNKKEPNAKAKALRVTVKLNRKENAPCPTKEISKSGGFHKSQ